ncbi:hypothetical protein SBADM41S_02612 [Streptomyces badius]
MPAKRRLFVSCIAALALSLLAGGGIAGQSPPGTDSVDGAAPGGPRAGSATAHGAYLDYGPEGVSRMADFSRWLGGAELRVGHTYLPGDLWVNIEGSPDFLDAWADWRRADPDRMFVLNVPMLERNEERVPDDEVRTLLRAGAAGDYDQHFTRLAERLVELGVPDTVIVLGWEMNGTTYTHRCGPDPTSWKAYWERIVTAMRAVPGQEFRFDFTPSRGRDAVPWTECYPGDDVVDIIGMDSYDQPPGETFDDQVTDPYGLQKHVDFAAERGKPISFPEWGLFRNGDNPEYMRRMLEWIARHESLYQTVTDYCPHGAGSAGALRGPGGVPDEDDGDGAPAAPWPGPTPTPRPTPTPGRRRPSRRCPRSLLPQTLRGGTALDVAWSYLPADAKDGVGGDWFDVIPLSGARVGLVIGDVVGHGIGAAATMGRLRTAVQTLADMDLPPDELLARLDDLVLRLSEEERTGGPAERGGSTVVGATCLYAVYDPTNGSCTMARAGHPRRWSSHRTGRSPSPTFPPGRRSGSAGCPSSRWRWSCPKGASSVSTPTGSSRGRTGTSSTAWNGWAGRCPGWLQLEDLCPAVVKKLLPVPQPDDIALLLARTHVLSPEHLVSWDVPLDPAAVGEARAKVSRQLEAWGLEELAMTTELIVSELVTNAIRYASGPVRLRLLFQAALTCEVSDASNTSPRLRHARTTDEEGRARAVPRRAARPSVGHALHAAGKIIWAEQPIP